MADEEIKEYLGNNNYSVRDSDGIMKILNRSYQILDTVYDDEARTMRIVTPDNVFTFEWILGDGK